MKIDEAIRRLKADKEYLKDHNICNGEEIDFAINIMELQMINCNTCKYGESTSGALLYCLNHGCYMNPNNLCRDWEREE